MRKFIFTSIALLIATPALAQAEAAPDLASCIAITGDAERLACYDARAQVQRAANPAPAPAAPAASAASGAQAADEDDGGGFSLGALAGAISPFSGGGGAEAGVVMSSIRSGREFVPGRFRFTLENGQVWEQVSSSDRMFLPGGGAGQQAEISQAPLGGYMMRIGDRSGVRVNRVE